MSHRADLESALASVRFLDNRRPDSPPAEVGAAFKEVAPYRDGGVFVGRFRGLGPWERHPQGDEFIHVLKGRTLLVLRTRDGDTVEELGAGTVAVVPRGVWHHLEAPEGVTLLSITPQPTEHAQDGESPSPD